MGAIYLARDTLLHRDVALKLLFSGDSDAQARSVFLQEARALARVAHPNVVAVYRVGEAEGDPFIVTELIRGSSLQEVQKPMEWRRAAELCLQAARGLAAAHKRQVLHRDVKPGNIMMSETGEVKLVDFGLAKALDDTDRVDLTSSSTRAQRTSLVFQSGDIIGTPLYMAPETLLGDVASVSSDVYGLGASLFELVVGIAPRETLPENTPVDEWISATPVALSEIPSVRADVRISRIVERALAFEASARFESADDLADALEVLLAEEELDTSPGNPYRGLESFDQEHRGLFFGRELETRALVRRVQEESFVLVAGDSGLGKSSLCKAGVLPALVEQGVAQGRVTVASLVPGARPIEALSRALSPWLDADETTLITLQDGDDAAIYRRVAARLEAGEVLILFIDQLEELCTLSDSNTATRFAETLKRCCIGPRVRILATVRSDYLGQVSAIDPLHELVGLGLYILRPLSAEAMRAAVLKPALRKGTRFESDDMVEELARSASEAAGGLPLLEFALARIWSARKNAPVISRTDLDSIGSLAGALSRHADAVIAALSESERLAAKSILLRLVSLDRTRARRAREELLLGESDSAALDALVRGRLVVARSVGNTNVYEVAHEALINKWEMLGEWLDSAEEQRAFLNEIELAADLWDRRGRRDDETWTDEPLARAEMVVRSWALDLPPKPRSFLDAGLARKYAASRRRRLLWGAAVGLTALVAVVSTAAAVEFSRKEKEAIRQQAEIRLASADMGIFELELEAFDWDPEALKASTPSNLPAMNWDLYEVDHSDRSSPGVAFAPENVVRGDRVVEAGSIHQRVEARSGAAFLKVTSRGGDCAPSWIYLQRLPGFNERTHPAKFKLKVPTCQASASGTVRIPAGQFYRNVDGPKEDDPTVDELAWLPDYVIDKTEVTRAAFMVYAAMSNITGEAPAPAGYLQLEKEGNERLPVVGINYNTARGYCRYLGKALPTIDEWQKAFRGGLTIDGVDNPNPKRMTPWLGKTTPRSANIQGREDGFPALAPVGSFPDDRSPYGVVDLAGNVSEWTRASMEVPRLRGLRVVLGANWNSAASDRETEVSWRNSRPDRYLDYGLGVRCVRASR